MRGHVHHRLAHELTVENQKIKSYCVFLIRIVRVITWNNISSGFEDYPRMEF